MSDNRVEVRNLSKRFPGTTALDRVDVSIRAGEVHALCGGNGSGKSTLVKILAGVQQGEPGGSIRIGEVADDADSWTVAEANRAGVRTVHQDLGVFPELSVTENLFLGRTFSPDRFGRIHWRAIRSEAKDILRRFEIDVSPRTPMARLSLGQQAQVAIARAMQDHDEGEAGLLILDESTAALPRHESEALLDAARRYAARGISILFISHRLDEVLRVADRTTVFRDGRSAGTFDANELDENRLIELIVGRRLDTVLPPAPETASDSVVLELRGLAAGPLRDIDLTVRRGEIVGIAGLLGAGRTELLQTIFGDRRVEKGEVVLDGKPVHFKHPSGAMKAGVAFVPESRSEASFADLSVTANMSMSVLGSYWRKARLRGREMQDDAVGLASEFDVKTASVSAPMASLSGGNQQKVILARWLRRRPKLLLLDEPTQGVDVGARADIYKMIDTAVGEGAAAIVVSSDMEELSHVVDRAVVMREGRLLHEVSREMLSPERLTQLCYAEEDTVAP